MIALHHLVFGRKYGNNSTSIFLDGNKINYTATNITYAIGRKGLPNEAFQFNNSNIITDVLPSTNVFSFSFWLKAPSTLPNFIGLFSSWNYISSQRIPICALNSFGGTKSISGGSGMPGVSWDNVGTTKNDIIINDNTWKYITIIVDTSKSASNEVEIYVNSVKLIINKFSNLENTYTFPSLPFRIGALAGTENYIGLMQDFKIFTRPLIQTEITNLYNE